jgi:hypothetical protein
MQCSLSGVADWESARASLCEAQSTRDKLPNPSMEATAPASGAAPHVKRYTSFLPVIIKVES